MLDWVLVVPEYDEAFQVATLAASQVASQVAYQAASQVAYQVALEAFLPFQRVEKGGLGKNSVAA